MNFPFDIKVLTPRDIIIFCDGAGPKKMPNGLKAMGAGYIVYNSMKVPIQKGKFRYEHQKGSSNMAEILAIRDALFFTITIEPVPTKIILCCDNKNAVGWASGQYHAGLDHIKDIVSEVKELMRGRYVRVYHIERKYNVEADALSKEGYNEEVSEIKKISNKSWRIGRIQ